MAFVSSEKVISKETVNTTEPEGKITTEIIKRIFYEERDGVMKRIVQSVKRVSTEEKIPKIKKRFRVGKAISKPTEKLKTGSWGKRVLKKQVDSDTKDNKLSTRSVSNSGKKSFLSGFRDKRRAEQNERYNNEHLYTIFLDNIPDYDRRGIGELVQEVTGLNYHNIKRINVVTDYYTGKSRGKAFVVFDTTENANMAQKKLHNQVCGSQIIHVAMAEKRNRT